MRVKIGFLLKYENFVPCFVFPPIKEMLSLQRVGYKTICYDLIKKKKKDEIRYYRKGKKGSCLITSSSPSAFPETDLDGILMGNKSIRKKKWRGFAFRVRSPGLSCIRCSVFFFFSEKKNSFLLPLNRFNFWKR